MPADAVLPGKIRLGRKQASGGIAPLDDVLDQAAGKFRVGVVWAADGSATLRLESFLLEYAHRSAGGAEEPAPRPAL